MVEWSNTLAVESITLESWRFEIRGFESHSVLFFVTLSRKANIPQWKPEVQYKSAKDNIKNT